MTNHFISMKLMRLSTFRSALLLATVYNFLRKIFVSTAPFDALRKISQQTTFTYHFLLAISSQYDEQMLTVKPYKTFQTPPFYQYC